MIIFPIPIITHMRGAAAAPARSDWFDLVLLGFLALGGLFLVSLVAAICHDMLFTTTLIGGGLWLKASIAGCMVCMALAMVTLFASCIFDEFKRHAAQKKEQPK